MTTAELVEIFADYAGEYNQNKNIQADRIKLLRPERYRFTIIERLLPKQYNGGQDVSTDRITFAIDVDSLADRAKREDVIDLIRCGFQYDPSLHRFWVSLRPSGDIPVP